MGAFKICKKGPCGISITGFEEYNNGTLSNYEDYISINVLSKIDSKGNSNLEDYSIDEHDNPILDQTDMIFQQDGLYEVHHFVVLKEEKPSINSTWVLNKIKEAQENNTEESILTFCYCRLQECYFKYANEFLIDYCSKCKKETKTEFDIIYLGITVLRYLLDLGRLYEAQTVLDQLTGCSGVCKQHVTYNKYNDCGCS